MKKNLIEGILALATLTLFACQNKEMDVVESTVVLDDNVVFTAEMEQPVDTKVFADANLKVLWNADDFVSIFNKYTYNRQYRFQGETGDNSGIFKAEPVQDFVTGNELEAIYAVYPYATATKISNEGEISFVLPEDQAYAKDSFGQEANLMVSSTEDNNLLFRNVGGYLGIKLYGEGVSVSKVSIQGNSGEILSGKATITAPVNGIPVLAMAEDADPQVNVVCSEPVALGTSNEDYTEFWFVLPPVTFEQGLTLTVTDNKGETFQKSTSKVITIERSRITRMAPVGLANAGPVVPPVPDDLAVDLGLPSGMKWASMNLGATSPEQAGDFFAYGEIAPKDSYTKENYAWYDAEKSAYTKYTVDTAWGYRNYVDPADDAARVILGEGWWIPTQKDFKELLDNCDLEYVDVEGVPVMRFTSKLNGASIIIPRSGYFGQGETDRPSALYWFADRTVVMSNQYTSTWGDLYIGMPIRAVYGTRTPVTSVSINFNELRLGVGAYTTIVTTVLPENASCPNIGFSSSDPTVVTFINRRGDIKALKPGRAVLSVISDDGQKTARCQVTVTEGFDGPSAVNLGLPSGVAWANCNLGAATPAVMGVYYAWGETAPKETYNKSTYVYWNGSSFTKYNESDGLKVLASKDDAASQNLGNGWRMPTHDDIYELIHNCTITEMVVESIRGYQFTGPNGHSIFIPIGDTSLSKGYWSASLYRTSTTQGSILYEEYDHGYHPTIGALYREDDCLVRPVKGSSE